MAAWSRAERVVLGAALLLTFGTLGRAALRIDPNLGREPGDVIDRFEDVAVYHNGGVLSAHGRRLTKDGYNVGLTYQCVEFVKRYYLERHGHRMPDTYGHAYSFFDGTVPDGGMNTKRGLSQYTNGSSGPPRVGDLVVFGRAPWNPYGHVAIVSQVEDGRVQIVQQNAGPFGPTREWLPLRQDVGRWHLEPARISGWLRMP